MITVRSRELLELKIDGTNVERMEIDVDTASELPAVDDFEGKLIAQGSIAWDISTGDFYGMGSDGQWVVQ